MCTGRVDPSFVITSLKEGADGIIIVGCLPGECHYATDGNLHAYAMTLLLKRIFGFIGLDPKRLRMEFLSSAEGVRFAEVMNSFIKEMKDLGPIGKKENLAQEVLTERLDAVLSLLPYIKLVERERLRFPENSVKAIDELFNDRDVERMIEKLILDKIRMVLILRSRKKGIDPKAWLEESRELEMRKAIKLLGELEREGFLISETRRSPRWSG